MKLLLLQVIAVQGFSLIEIMDKNQFKNNFLKKRTTGYSLFKLTYYSTAELYGIASINSFSSALRISMTSTYQPDG